MVDLERVTMHELGHLLGLEHPDAAGFTVQSIMNSSAVDSDSPQEYDVLAAEFLYGAPGIPPNDSFASAAGIRLPIGNTAITVRGYNTNATKEGSEPNHANNAGGQSVWWKWIAPSSGPVSLTTADSAFDTVLGVYTGSDVTALTAVASNDNVQDGINLTSTVTFNAAAGTTYYFAVDGYNNGAATDAGGIALNLTFVPAATVKSETASSGHSVTFSINAPSGSTIQWQVSADAGGIWSNVVGDTFYSGETTPNLTISTTGSGMSGLRFRAVVTTADGVSSTSDYGVLNVVQSMFSFPSSITIDGLGNLYVGDTSLDTVQKIISSTTVSTVAGTASTAGTTDGAGAAARFNQPGGLAANSDGVLGVSDTANATIRVIQTDGTVTTLAGSSANHGSVDAAGTAARFASPIGIARDSSGTYYVADAMNHVIRKVTSAGVVTTFAGKAGVAGAADGVGSAASFNNPTGIAVDSSGNVYVADTTNNLIRKITSSGSVTTIAGVTGVAGSTDGTGSAALFNSPGGLAVDTAGNVYLADTGNSTIRRITADGVVVTLAGLPGVAGFKDGSNSNAWFNQPKAVAVDIDGSIYVADTGNAAIRKVAATGAVTTLVLTARRQWHHDHHHDQHHSPHDHRNHHRRHQRRRRRSQHLVPRCAGIAGMAAPEIYQPGNKSAPGDAQDD